MIKEHVLHVQTFIFPLLHSNTGLLRDVPLKRAAVSTFTIPAGFSIEQRISSRGFNSFSPHLALSVSPWPCQRLSWSSCSSLSTRLGLYAEFISKVNTWMRDKHRIEALKRLSSGWGLCYLFFDKSAPWWSELLVTTQS